MKDLLEELLGVITIILIVIFILNITFILPDLWDKWHNILMQ